MGIDVLIPYSFTDAALASVTAAMSIRNVTQEKHLPDLPASMS